MSQPTTRLDELLAANITFAKTWSTPPTMTQLRAGPGDPLLVLTCMDPRVVPEQFLGPAPRVAVFRNAGGRATPDVVRTISVLRSLRSQSQGVTVMVVHHTDCGMTHLTNHEIIEGIKARGVGTDESVRGIDFGCFKAEDLEKVIVEDMDTLRASELLKGVQIKGFVLETETGLLREVEE